MGRGWRREDKSTGRVNGKRAKQKSVAGQWDGEHKRINLLSLSGAQSRRSLLENGVQLRAGVCDNVHASGLGTRYAPRATAQTPAVLNMVCLMLPFSVWGCSGAWPEVFGRGAWIAPSLTAVPQTGNKSLRKYRIIEDGTKSHGNLLVVLPTLPPDSRQIPLFMLNRVE